MKTLLLLRHAKSSWEDERQGDHERPLSERGQSEAPLVGQLLRDHGLRPDFVLCSTAVRARQTASQVLEASGWEIPIDYLNELYLTDAETYLEVLRRQSDEHGCLLIVGHNPCLESVLYALVQYQDAFPTSALAHLQLAIGHWSELHRQTPSQLQGIWRPRVDAAG